MIGLLEAMLEWERKPMVFQSTHTSGGHKITQSAVNWRKVGTNTVPGRISKIYDSWKKQKDPISKFVSWDNISKDTGLSVEDIAAEVKAVFNRDYTLVGRTVNRMGDGTYFKFKGNPL